MQIDRQQPVHTGALNHVRNELRRDRRARRAWAAILPRVAHVRDYCGDARRRSAPAGVHHHQQLHEVVVGWRARGLHDEDIASPHVLHQLDIHLTIAEAPDIRPPQRRLQMARDVDGQRGVPVSREQRERFVRRCHLRIRPLSSRASHGWGGRIRTSEWRDQNPLPYHLATPQSLSRSCAGEPFRPRAT